MQNKILVSLISSILLVSTNVPTYSEFNYKFEIKTNSYNPLDEAAGYYYKEQLIDKVEYQLFTLDEKEHSYYIIIILMNISSMIMSKQIIKWVLFVLL